MLIAKVNGTAVEQIGDYRDLFQGVAFPHTGPTAEWLAANSCMPIGAKLPYDPTTQVLAQVAPYILDGVVYTCEAQLMDTEQTAEYQKNMVNVNRDKAQELLKQTDWSEIPSVTNPANSHYLVNGAAFVDYRNALRAVAVAPTYNAVFPTAPVEQLNTTVSA